MMREILFRGKRVDNGEWIQGDFCNPCNIVFLENGYDPVLGKDDVPCCNDFEVIPETVGQYTGLTDKNGEKIFEGDILESRASENKEDWKVWQVGFEDGSFVFDSVRKSIKSRRKFKHEQNLLCACEIDFYGLVKIGDIHDNSELLEVQNE